jgi:hypothetical protein
MELTGQVGHLRVVGIGLDTRGSQRLDFFPSYLQQITVVHDRSSNKLICKRFFIRFMQEQSEFHYIFFADVSRADWIAEGALRKKIDKKHQQL